MRSILASVVQELSCGDRQHKHINMHATAATPDKAAAIPGGSDTRLKALARITAFMPSPYAAEIMLRGRTSRTNTRVTNPTACLCACSPVLIATRTLNPLNSSWPGLLLSLLVLNTTPALSWDSRDSGQSVTHITQEKEGRQSTAHHGTASHSALESNNNNGQLQLHT